MSVLERRLGCPGSMRAEEGRPDRPSTYAQRGTLLHAAAAEALIRNIDVAEIIDGDPEGVDIVQAYVDEVREAHARLGGVLRVEHTFWMRDIHDLFRGTADAVIVAPPHLYVADLKTGAGHAVPVRRPDGRVSFQLGGYGLGAMQTVPTGVAIDSIELVVVQPRLGPPQRTMATPEEMLDLAGDLLGIARAALDPDAPLIPGDHCAFCRAAGECPALRAQALADARSDFGDPPLPTSLAPEEIGHLLGRADMVEAWIAALRAHAYALAEGGGNIPGWKLVAKRGRRIWADEDEAIGALEATDMPAGDAFVTKLVSPAQAEKALKRLKLPLPSNWFDLVTMTDPGTTLVPEADKRPAVKAPTPGLEFNPATPEEF